MAKKKRVERAADPARTASALRGFGYDFGPAICDLVDNSIAAEATHINIKIGFDHNGDPSVTIMDNGHGMDEKQLLNAIMIGSDERVDPNSLGKFGFGLKTASTAFCRDLVVTSKAKGDGQDILSTSYDLDLIMEENKWVYDIGGASNDEKDTFESALESLSALSGESEKHGTLIQWKKVDRLLIKQDGEEYKNPLSALDTKRENARERVGLVFHRFLNPKDKRAHQVNIYINGEPVEFWDPFQEHFHKDIKPVTKKTLDVYDHESGKSHEAKIRGFILPLDKELDGWVQSVHKISLKDQGIYAYRENRLVDGPDWFKIGVKESHINTLRVELSFTAESDSAFGVSVTKDKLVFPAGIFEAIQQIVTPLKREADAKNRAATKLKGKKKAKPGSKIADSVIGNTIKELDKPNLQQDGKVVTMSNNTGKEVPLTDNKGGPLLSISVREVQQGAHVVEEDTLDDGVLWRPGVSKGESRVELNRSHDWYRKSYVPSLKESSDTEAVEYLLYALAVAELNNTNLLNDEWYDQFRVEVSRNLRKLVKHLPDPALDE